jgi:hypothetical protein
VVAKPDVCDEMDLGRPRFLLTYWMLIARPGIAADSSNTVSCQPARRSKLACFDGTCQVADFHPGSLSGRLPRDHGQLTGQIEASCTVLTRRPAMSLGMFKLVFEGFGESQHYPEVSVGVDDG